MRDPNLWLSSEVIENYDRLRESAALIDLGDWALLELAGDDRIEWLQGQATNDVRSLLPGSRLSFCLCEATGQLLAVVDAWALEDRILMVVPRERCETVLARVERMTILEDVVARDLSSEYVGVSIQGPSADAELTKIMPLPSDDAGVSSVDSEGTSAFMLRSMRTASGGWDVWRSRMGAGIAGRVAHADAVEATRLEAGIPKWGIDMGPRTLPAEMGPDFEARYVSYGKGCYTGQEVLMRMHSRGHTNRTWVGLVSQDGLEVGKVIEYEGREVGRIASVAFSPALGWIGAATLRNEATIEGMKVHVGDVEAEVRRMPIFRAP